MTDTMLRRQLRPAIVMTVVLCVITGLIYPGVVTALAQLFFPRQANGSLVTVNGRVVGSALIGQPFTQPYYFHPRPSAAGTGYDDTLSGGTNLGPTSAKLADTLIASAVDSAMKNDGASEGTDPLGHGHLFRIGRRPAHFTRHCIATSRTRGRCARRERQRDARARRAAHRGAAVRILRRGARERPAAQHRRRLGISAALIL